MTYENWTIEKSIINYSGDDEGLQKQSEEARKEYAEVAEWCNQGGEYHIEEAGDVYKTVKNPEPSQEELIKAEIAELKAQLAESDYKCLKYVDGALTEAEYAEVKVERQDLRARINELEGDVER
jgi:hypothetical protein